MLITTNMGIQVDPIGLNNINLIRYTRPNVVKLNTTRRCLFGRSDPEQNRRIYENSANNERNRCIERYGFDPVKSKFVKEDENNIDKNETVSIDKNVQQCLDNVDNVVEPRHDIVRRENYTNLSENIKECNDVLKHKLKGTETLKRNRPEHKTKISDYFPKKKKPSS